MSIISYFPDRLGFCNSEEFIGSEEVYTKYVGSVAMGKEEKDRLIRLLKKYEDFVMGKDSKFLPPERSVKDVIEQIVRIDIDGFIIGYVELTEDIVFRKIPTDTRGKFVIGAIDIGRETARNIADETGTKYPVLIAEKIGAKVVISDKENVQGTLLIRSEYDPKLRTIFVYEGSLSPLRDSIRRHKLEQVFSIEDITAVHVAHELFHHIETTRIGLVSRKFKVDTLNWGGFRIKSGVRTLTEIAAHSFAKTLLNLNFYPALLDYTSENRVRQMLRKLGELGPEIMIGS